MIDPQWIVALSRSPDRAEEERTDDAWQATGAARRAGLSATELHARIPVVVNPFDPPAAQLRRIRRAIMWSHPVAEDDLAVARTRARKFAAKVKFQFWTTIPWVGLTAAAASWSFLSGSATWFQWSIYALLLIGLTTWTYGLVLFWRARRWLQSSDSVEPVRDVGP
jgi:hypothetical protein